MSEITLQPAARHIGPILWQNVASGMTVAEVQSARSDVVVSSDSDVLPSGARCLLYIPDMSLASLNYFVLFHFLGDSLAQVTFKSSGGARFTDFRAVSLMLRAKYGTELSSREAADSLCAADWIAPNGVNISVQCNPILGSLSINYQTLLVTDAGKL